MVGKTKLQQSRSSVFISDKTPLTNKEEVYRYKVTARDVLSIIG